MQAIVNAYKDDPKIDKLNEDIVLGKLPMHISSLDKRVVPLLMESIDRKNNLRLIITHDEKRAREIVADYRFYDRQVYFYQAKDALFYYADVHNNTTVKNRIEVFKHIAENDRITVVTTIEGLMDRIPKLSEIVDSAISISVADGIDQKEFSQKLSTLGYEKTEVVETPGQFSVRGGIIDIYPITEECPYRVELWGDDIDSIRSFDVDSQRSIENVNDLLIYPSCEMVLSDKRIEEGLKKIEHDHKKQIKKLKEEFRTEQCARLNKMVENTKEELREFNSTMGLDSFVTYFYEETVSFLDYFPKDIEIFIDEPEKVKSHAKVYSMEFAASMSGRLEGGYVLPGQANIIIDGDEIIGKLQNRRIIMFSELYKKQFGFKEAAVANFSSKSLISYNNSFEALMKDISDWSKKEYKIIILSPSGTRAKRIVGNLKDNGIFANFTDGSKKEIKAGEIVVGVGRLETGFEIAASKLVVISEGDIFTSKELKKRKKLPKYKGDKINGFTDISVGDYVVHEKHGVGIYRGIDKVETDGVLKDYITIEYDKGSKLFVPVEQLSVIGKLGSKEGAKPKLNRLGGTDWEKVRSRVKGHIEDIAMELVELYAIRESTKGFAYSEDSPWQKEFEEMFPYEETIDQQKAIDDTKRDMESDRIMDRLVCGDVGFGKTEVAIRAAFKAVQDNKQVAYLVPTTILAEQHYNTFCERMQNFPVNIRMLSRFCSAKQSKEVLAEMKNGQVDIVIGTHRLLSKDIEFKNLGLLIIDEEQRFGVKHKEQIKHMKTNVDVLTLTATPIPRTLHMSLVGLRDISLLEEPPVDRMPIQTYIMEYDLEFVKEAINRELNRNGQAYYVYNRVNTIEDITLRLRAVLPNARIEFAHGKMNERELEDIMRAFINKEIDVLVSTTIIETGLDIPNVNTIIIHDADKFGLSQLYQLRGRVGRSSRSAYAFLLYKRDKMIKEVAEKRLKAIREYTDLGSGYKISMKDLEIRGAGNLLGQEQSGNIEAVGYDLYCKMLSDAIKRLQGTSIEADFATAIDLPVDAYIPDDYIKNEYMKLDLYKRISRCDTSEDTDMILEEVLDRFGKPPKPFERLLSVACLRGGAHMAYIQEIKYINGEMIFIVYPQAPIKTKRIDMLLKRFGGKLRFSVGSQSCFRIKILKTTQEKFIMEAINIVENLAMLSDKNENELDIVEVEEEPKKVNLRTKFKKKD